MVEAYIVCEICGLDMAKINIDFINKEDLWLLMIWHRKGYCVKG